MAATYMRLLGLSAALLVAAQGTHDPEPEFDWTTIEPSWDLRYTPCYEKFQCARLLMPLDWLDTQGNNNTVALAVIKLPASVDATDDGYGGTVITNPGGPGDSGVLHVLRNGHYIQSMMGANEEYEVLSFDPRGMAYTTPRSDCYASESARLAATWQSGGLGGPSPDSSDSQLKRMLALGAAHGMQCAETGRDAHSIHEFSSTASVARDVMRIVDEVDLLEQRRKRKTQPDVVSGNLQRDRSQRPLAPTAGGSKPEARLQYYGTSYGTVLGNFILSMFPGRVKRMVLDGVVVAEEWVVTDWTNSLSDLDNAIDYFYRTCYEVGAKCALKSTSDKSWHDIKHRVYALMSNLSSNPLPSKTEAGPEVVITGQDVLEFIFSRIYSPLDYFELMATVLSESVRGNHTLLLRHIVPSMDEKQWGDYTWMSSAFETVVCGDGEDMRGHDLAYWKKLLRDLESRYPSLVSMIAALPFTCAGWQARPKYRFTGPFRTPEADPSNVDGRPSAPLLLLSSRYDPVTPLESAYKVSKGHPGSRVLVQNSVGHCTLLSGPSKCTRGVVRAYMQNGTLPDEGKECEGDCAPWEDCPYERGRFPR